MKFGKRYSKVTVLMAMLHGVLIGVAAVAIIGLLLLEQRERITTLRTKNCLHLDRRQLKICKANGKTVAVVCETAWCIHFNGICSSFIAEDPSFSKAAVIQDERKILSGQLSD